MIKAALYLILLLGLAAWAFVSRDCRSEEEAELSPFLRIFQRMAVHIWQGLKPVRQKIPGLEEVRADLRLLHPSRRVIGREDAYYTGKIRNLLLFSINHYLGGKAVDPAYKDAGKGVLILDCRLGIFQCSAPIFQ